VLCIYTAIYIFILILQSSQVIQRRGGIVERACAKTPKSNSRTTRFGGCLSATPVVTRLPRLLDLTRVDICASPLPLTFHLYRPSLISRRQRPAIILALYFNCWMIHGNFYSDYYKRERERERERREKRENHKNK